MAFENNGRKMFYVAEIDTSTNTVFLEGILGGHVTKEIIPQMVEFLNNSEYSAFTAHFNGVNLQVTKGTTVEEATATWLESKERFDEAVARKIQTANYTRFSIDKVEKSTNTVVLEGRGGHITNEIIPQMVQFLNNSMYSAFTAELNGVVFKINKGTSVEEATAIWEDKFNKLNEEQAKKREAYEKSEAGLVEKEYNSFIYHSIDELFEELQALKGINIKSNAISTEECVSFFEKLLVIIQKSAELEFKHEDILKFSSEIKRLVNINHIKELDSLVTDKNLSVGEAMKLPNNLTFPITVLKQLVDSSDSTFNFGLYKSTEAFKGSWIMEWVSTQKEFKKQTNVGI